MVGIAFGFVAPSSTAAQIETSATATVTITADALGPHARNRLIDIRGLAGSMRALAGRSAHEGSEPYRDWLNRAAATIEAHADRRAATLSARDRTLAAIEADLARLDARWSEILEELQAHVAGWGDAAGEAAGLLRAASG